MHRTFVGSWLTSQEMAGFSISLMKLDAELKHYLDLPASSFGFTSSLGRHPGEGRVQLPFERQSWTGLRQMTRS